jgi:hypothetical protein
MLYYLIDTAFADKEPDVQFYTARTLGSVLSAKNWASVSAILSTDEEWGHCQNCGLGSLALKATDQILSRVLQYVDSILEAQQKDQIVPKNRILIDELSCSQLERFHHSAARTLFSFCTVAKDELASATKIAILSSIRQAVRQWSRQQQSSTRNVDLDGFYFAELLRVAHCTNYKSIVANGNGPTGTHTMLQDLFASFSDEKNKTGELQRTRAAWKERQFNMVSSFIQAILIASLRGESHFSVTGEVDFEKSVDACLPHAISNFVAGKDYSGLQMMASYKIYVLGQRRYVCKLMKRSEPISFHSNPLSGFVLGDVSQNPAARLWNRDTENQARQLCLAPGLVEKIIPLIFMSSGGDQLSFFTDIVLQKKISLKQLVTSREMLTLKNFVLELGRNPELSEQMIVGMKKAAMVRSKGFEDTGNESALHGVVLGDDDAVTSWVTPNFMFLLVNVVQYKWSTKTIGQQIMSLTSLQTILDFLQSVEAAQYFPQIMATVNAALSEEPTSLSWNDDRAQLSHCRLLAVQVLSKFVRLIARTQLDVIGQNLTSMVVALIPIFSTSENKEEGDIKTEEESLGVALLEWLSSQASLGQCFAEIPFLPPTSSLDTVRAMLKARGVHFDHLLTGAAHGMEDSSASTRSVTSDSAFSGDSRGAASNVARQAALRRRLEMVASLLENESVSVRRVALTHLTALLRSNRELFHSLIENEGTASLKRFVTVSYRDQQGM